MPTVNVELGLDIERVIREATTNALLAKLDVGISKVMENIIGSGKRGMGSESLIEKSVREMVNKYVAEVVIELLKEREEEIKKEIRGILKREVTPTILADNVMSWLKKQRFQIMAFAKAPATGDDEDL